jgi:hypothetical protein
MTSFSFPVSMFTTVPTVFLPDVPQILRSSIYIFMEQLIDLNSKHCFVANVPVVSCDIFLDAFIKRLRKATVSFVVSVRPHGTGRLTPNAFS